MSDVGVGPYWDGNTGVGPETPPSSAMLDDFFGEVQADADTQVRQAVNRPGWQHHTSGIEPGRQIGDRAPWYVPSED